MPIRRSYGRRPDTYDPRDQRLHVGAEAPVPLSDFWSLCYELGGLASMGTEHMPPIYDQSSRLQLCRQRHRRHLFDYVHHKQGFPLPKMPDVVPEGAAPSSAESRTPPHL